LEDSTTTATVTEDLKLSNSSTESATASSKPETSTAQGFELASMAN